MTAVLGSSLVVTMHNILRIALSIHNFENIEVHLAFVFKDICETYILLKENHQKTLR